MWVVCISQQDDKAQQHIIDQLLDDLSLSLLDTISRWSWNDHQPAVMGGFAIYLVRLLTVFDFNQNRNNVFPFRYMLASIREYKHENKSKMIIGKIKWKIKQ